jgi:hypothetical protein
MSFIGKAVGSVAKAIGLVPDAPQVVAPPEAAAPAPPAPTVANSTVDLDAAAQEQARRMGAGRTSTMLTGGAGLEEDKTKTSKVLLGQ